MTQQETQTTEIEAVAQAGVEEQDFDLHALMRELYADPSLSGPDEFTDALFDRIPGDDRDAVLRLVLRSYTRVWLTTQRRQVDEDEGESAEPAESSGALPSQAGRPWHVGLKDRFLLDRINVGRDHWKLLADSTVADLDFVIAERKKLADKNKSSAAYYGRIRAAMLKRGVERVRDLPASVLRRFSGRAR